MNRFFVEDHQINGDQAYIDNEEVNHIANVLRLKVGDKITICNRQCKAYCCIIKDIAEMRIDLVVESVLDTVNELSTKIYLFQGIPKSDKMELIIQKSVELGVYEVIPVKMKRSIVKLKDNKSDKKVERWNKISLSAAKQSKRAIIPAVKDPMTLVEAIHYAKQLDTTLVPYENAEDMSYTREIIHSMKGKGSIGVFIGPEGGFDEQEINELDKINARKITLGNRILRTETAGLTILSILMFELEEQ